MRTELGGGVPDSSAFATALDELKREGSNVLVVGDETAGAHSRACERMVGNDGEDERYRLFVLTERADRSCIERGEVGREGTTRIVSRSDDRSGEGHTRVPESVVGTELLSVFAAEIMETVDEFETEAGGLRPSQLRVCLDSLAPLLGGHDSRNVFRLVHMTTSRVKQVNGMGHFHLPVGRDHDATRLLEPLFDAVVEVRTSDGKSEQRWHLRDQRTTSDWLTI